MSITSRFVFGLAAVLFFGCAQKPTKVFTSEDVDVLFLEKELVRPLEITTDTIIIDVREPFDYAMVHHPNAVNIQWSDFSEPESVSPGILKKDLELDAKRLAAWGIEPGSRVVVAGKGLGGAGAEGRVAWTLLYLGVRDVQTIDTDKMGMRYSNLSPPPRASKPMWKPVLHEKILVNKDEFLESRKNSALKVIDVRTPLEFANKKISLADKYPEIHATNIEWKFFFNDQGRPSPSIKQQLQDAHIDRHDRILLISNKGVRSGAVAYALLSLGYKNVANYAGGFVELLELKK